MYKTIVNPPTAHAWDCNTILEVDGGSHFSFQACPNQYNFRGDANTAADAENIAWERYQAAKPRLCQYDHSKGDNCERRGYRNGCGFCKHCGHFCSNVFEPDEICVQCKARCYWTHDKNGKWWCETCAKMMPVDVMTRQQLLVSKHGTVAEFSRAAWNTLGECSADEIMAAIYKYDKELSEAGHLDHLDELNRSVTNGG